MTIQDWQNNPDKCRRQFLREIRDRLAMSEHPCSDSSSDENCPCEDKCAYRQHFDELERVKAMDVQAVDDEQITILQESLEQIDVD